VYLQFLRLEFQEEAEESMLFIVADWLFKALAVEAV
jgi:hypothetical protein